MIYTTNNIENLNRQIRKTTKNKPSLKSPERLLDYLFMIIKKFECLYLKSYLYKNCISVWLDIYCKHYGNGKT